MYVPLWGSSNYGHFKENLVVNDILRYLQQL